MIGRRNIFLILMLVMLVRSTTFSQRRGGERPQFDRPVSSLQVINLMSDDPQKSRMDILYNIPRSFFVFVRSGNPAEADTYIARGEVYIEILDRKNASVARDFYKVELSQHASFPAQDSSFVSGIFSFNLSPDEYVISFEVKDRESSRHIMDNNHKVSLKNFHTSQELSDIIFSAPISAGPASGLSPVNFGGDLPFGKQVEAYVQIPGLCQSDSVTLAYSILSTESETHRQAIVMHDSVSHPTLSRCAQLKFTSRSEKISYTFADSLLQDASQCFFKMNIDTLSQGRYDMIFAVHGCGKTLTTHRTFTLRWIDMPASLRSLDLSVEALRYIMTEQEFQHIKSANAAEKRKLFDAFWKRKDTTPWTAFNEMMEEYYRRVDYAFVTYRTLHEENGVKTDRGKAYILYGPASRIERSLSPAGPPQEIWYYDRLQRKLIFNDESRKGDYKLVSAENL